LTSLWLVLANRIVAQQILKYNSGTKYLCSAA
jgi:hypothetical protein